MSLSPNAPPLQRSTGLLIDLQDVSNKMTAAAFESHVLLSTKIDSRGYGLKLKRVSILLRFKCCAGSLKSFAPCSKLKV